jgi:hypothetical protein
MLNRALMLCFLADCPPWLRQKIADKYEYVWFKNPTDITPSWLDPNGTTDWTGTFELSADLKERAYLMGRTLRTGAYQWGIGAVQANAAEYHQILPLDCLLASPTQPLWGQSPKPSPGNLGGPWHKVVNIASPSLQAKLIGFWRQWLELHDMDSILFDSWWPDGLASHVRDEHGMVHGTLEGPTHTPLWWCSYLKQFTDRMVDGLGQVGREVWINGVATRPHDPNDQVSQFLGRDNRNLAAIAPVLAEHVHRAYVSEDLARAQVVMLRDVVTTGARLFFCANPTTLQLTDPGVPYAIGSGYEQLMVGLYLAAANRPGQTYFGYHDGQPYTAMIAGAQPNVWYPYITESPYFDLDFGYPLEPPAAHLDEVPGVVMRDYSKCRVWLNMRHDWRTVPVDVPRRIWSPTNPTATVVYPPHANMAPRSAWVGFVPA